MPPTRTRYLRIKLNNCSHQNRDCCNGNHQQPQISASNKNENQYSTPTINSSVELPDSNVINIHSDNSSNFVLPTNVNEYSNDITLDMSGNVELNDYIKTESVDEIDNGEDIILETEEDDQASIIEGIMAKVTAMEKSISEINTNIGTITEEYASINAKLDRILNRMVSIPTQQNMLISHIDLKDLNCPFSQPEEVCEFERKLNDNEFFKDMVFKLSEIGGRTGTSAVQEAPKIALKISKSLFELKLLIMYTWTGKSKSDGATKLNFLKYEKIHALFFEVIKLACKDYSRAQNEHFFKNNMLKHNKLRMHREETKGINNDADKVTSPELETSNNI